MADQNRRLNGWKVIGAHFDRDRTTAIRWANERKMPVRRIPGGKTATVYAFRDELDAWAASQSRATFDESPVGERRRRPQELPRDSDIAALFLQARTAWSERGSEGIARAITAYQAVTASDPGFAPAWAGLAETFIVAADYGVGREADNYPEAGKAAERSLALDPRLASAHRAMASYQFGWMRDTVAAGASFRRAIELGQHDMLTHIWFGNALAYNGEYQAANGQYDVAQLADIGPLPLQINRAWLMWLAGDSVAAVARLRDLVARYPGNALAIESLSHALLGEGDLRGFVEQLQSRERACAVATTGLSAAQLEAALDIGVDRFLDTAIAATASDEAGRPAANLAWSAFFASGASDRDRLVPILEKADAAAERWSSGWIARHIARRWHHDSVVVALTARRSAPAMLPVN